MDFKACEILKTTFQAILTILKEPGPHPQHKPQYILCVRVHTAHGVDRSRLTNYK